MSILRLITILFISTLFSAKVNAAVFSSVTDGNWSTNATWGGSSHPILATADNITINDSVFETSDITIKAGGYLTIKSGAVLTVINLEFSNGSHILIEPGGRLIVLGNLTNKNNSIDVEVNGTIDVSGNFDNGNGGVIFGSGSMQVDGDYSGTGVTFGYVNDTIPSNSTISTGSLPVELFYFNYIAGMNEIILRWTTASEANNDFFTIERSVDGINFTEIGTVTGNGNSNSLIYYEFSDKEPISGISYYRLKQNDYDGTSEYIGLLSCKLNSTLNSIIFENPVLNNDLNITFTNEGTYNISLFNYNGQLYYHSIESVSALKNVHIPSFDLKSGLYILSVKNQTGMNETYKIIFE